MDTTAAHLTSGELFPVAIPPDSELAIVARRLDVEDQLPGVVAMTEELFGKPVQVQVTHDPEEPADTRISLRVCPGIAAPDATRLQSEWCRRLHEFGQPAFLAFCLLFLSEK